jgi:hypothetical protein
MTSITSKYHDAFIVGWYWSIAKSFSSTERFHSSDIFVIAQMKSAKAGYILHVYQALLNGALIYFSTEYSHLLIAVHHWFDAQIKEHCSGNLSEQDRHHRSPAD